MDRQHQRFTAKFRPNTSSRFQWSKSVEQLKNAQDKLSDNNITFGDSIGSKCRMNHASFMSLLQNTSHRDICSAVLKQKLYESVLSRHSCRSTKRSNYFLHPSAERHRAFTSTPVTPLVSQTPTPLCSRSGSRECLVTQSEFCDAGYIERRLTELHDPLDWSGLADILKPPSQTPGIASRLSRKDDNHQSACENIAEEAML